VREERERDHHFAFTNLTTALAANAVWFNSAFHRDALLAALPDWLRRMPDHAPLAAVDAVRAKAAGCLPLLPLRLAYPELFPPTQGHATSFYDGTPAGLAEVLAEAATRLARHDLWQGDPARARRAVARFTWPILAPQLRRRPRRGHQPRTCVT
jgi:hypothetical protein